MSETPTWRRCSACKKNIALGAIYQVCSVSTCNRPRTGLVFCSLACWDSHLPLANHREAWALERTAPRSLEPEPTSSGEPVRRLARSAEHRPSAGPPDEILIVASRLKDYIRTRSDMSTSDRILGPLSDHVRRLCDEAIEAARQEGRRTVLDRDVPPA